MKFCKFSLLFLVLFALRLLVCTSIVLKTQTNGKNLSKYICKIAKQIIESKTDTQDVLIGNLGGMAWTITANEIAGCISDSNAVVISDFQKVLTEKTLGKTSLAIMLAAISPNLLFQLTGAHHFGTVWNFKAKVIWIVQATTSSNLRFNILSILNHYGFIDAAIAHENDIGDVYIEFIASIDGKIVEFKNPSVHLSIFPDKLKSMNRFNYKVVVYDQTANVKLANNTIYSPLLYFLGAISAAQNARFTLIPIKDFSLMIEYWNKRLMHLTLNTAVYVDEPEPKLQTYVENGHCALVPLPSKTSSFQSIFTAPFDVLTWIFIFLTVLCCFIIWWMFRNRGAVDSPWLLAYGTFVIFIGQGVDFSRKNRMVLAILLQLIIVMVWILSNAYEGVITSFMIQPMHENRFKTFDDVVTSKYDILTDRNFYMRILSSEDYKTLETRLNTSWQQMMTQFSEVVAQKHYVFILKCDQANVILNNRLETGKRVSKFYYMIPEKIMPHLEQLEASYMNPFLERFQYFMDLCFQAGLMHIWQVFAFQTDSITNENESTEVVHLKLEDLSQVFSILTIGLILSLLMFLIEIFFHDFLNSLKLGNLALKLKNIGHQMAYTKRKQPRHPKYQKGVLYFIIHRRKRVKRLKSKKIKVRRIYVQPRFPVD